FGDYPRYTWSLRSGYGLLQTTWNSARTRKLLFEAGWSYMLGSYIAQYQPGTTPTAIARTDSTLGFTWGAQTLQSLGATYIPAADRSNRMAQRFSVTYITGSHGLKFGISNDNTWQGLFVSANGNVNYTVNKGKYVTGIVTCPTCGATS